MNPTFQATKGVPSAEAAQRQGLAIVVPDTHLGENKYQIRTKYDFGQGAGFYTDATEEPFKTTYNMHAHVHYDRAPGISQECVSLAWTDQRVLVDIVWEDTEHSLLHVRIHQNGQV